MDEAIEVLAIVKYLPTLRFSEFVSPWQTVLLEDVAARGSGHTPSKSFPHYYDGGIKWISLNDSNKLDQGYIYETNIKISEDGLKNSSAVLHPQESVVLSRDAGIGKSAVMASPMAVSQHFIVWQGKKEMLDNWFLYYKLQILKPEFERIAIGSTIKTIGLPYFKKLKLSIPAYPEQQKIASFLSAVDKKIQLLKRKKELLEQYKKGVMQQLFSGKLRFKDENGEDYPEWEEKKLGEVAITFSGGTPTSTKREYYQGDIPFIKSGEIKNSKTEQHITSDALKSSSAKLVRKGDLLYALYGATAGESAITKIDGAINQAVLCIRPVIDTQFLYFYLSGRKQDILEKYLQGGQGNLSASIIKSIGLNVPMRNEQQQIAKFLMAIDYKIDIVLNQITLTQTFKKGLLQQMFV